MTRAELLDELRVIREILATIEGGGDVYELVGVDRSKQEEVSAAWKVVKGLKDRRRALLMELFADLQGSSRKVGDS